MQFRSIAIASFDAVSHPLASKVFRTLRFGSCLTDLKETSMQVTFIAHAGFCLESFNTSIMLDPWFYSSDLENPILYGLLPPNKTIDFQTPPVQKQIQQFRPNVILVSHFHTHHSPLREIRELIQQCPSKKLTLGTPTLSEENREQILKNLGDCRDRVELKSFIDGQVSFTVGNFKISGFASTWDNHAIWLVESQTASFMHAADARINSNPMDRRIDPIWMRFQNLSPDLFVLSAAGHCMRKKTKEAKPFIYEHGTMSPTEAARVVELVRPKMSGIMGIQNHSFWTDRVEFSLPSDLIEDQFAWAINYLAPEVQSLLFRSGQIYDITHPSRIMNAISTPLAPSASKPETSL